MNLKKAFEINRETWNNKVDIHAESKFYDLDSFKKGRSSLHVYELNALPEVKGKTLLHLQCHFGQDTLSWSRMGAKCVGVDISDKAIDLARQLNNELELDAEFVCCNVLDTATYVEGTFDIVFTSYGVIGWLPDLRPWAEMISSKLAPGGTFYMVEFHPIVWMFDYLESPPAMKYGYQQSEAIYEEYEGTYADESSKEIISKEYGWNHGLGEVITALSSVGLEVKYLKEHMNSPYEVLPGLESDDSGMYFMPGGLYPLIFEFKALKKS